MPNAEELVIVSLNLDDWVLGGVVVREEGFAADWIKMSASLSGDHPDAKYKDCLLVTEAVK